MNELTPTPNIARIGFDVEAQTVSVTMSDGTRLTDRMRSRVPWDELSATETDLATGELTLRLRTGESLVVELGADGNYDLPARDRPVVYLDQCHWITLAKGMRSPDRVAKRDREPVRRIIELSRSKAIVLAMSGANRWEMAPAGQHRRDLGLTMVELSRGWQLRDPINVRGQELRRSMLGATPAQADAVVTLEPGAISSFDPGVSMEFEDAPPGFNELLERQTVAMASVAVLLEDHWPDESGIRGREIAAAWAKSFGELSAYLRDARTPVEHVRVATHGRQLADLRKEIAQAALACSLSPQQNAAWLDGADSAVEGMPYLRTLREVLYLRLRNADDHWTRNDLADSQYLCCAAAYVDYVAAERKFGDYLQRAARRYDGNAVTVTKLGDLVERLANAGLV